MRLEENWFENELENENICYIPKEYKKEYEFDQINVWEYNPKWQHMCIQICWRDKIPKFPT